MLSLGKDALGCIFAFLDAWDLQHVSAVTKKIQVSDAAWLRELHRTQPTRPPSILCSTARDVVDAMRFSACFKCYLCEGIYAAFDGGLLEVPDRVFLDSKSDPAHLGGTMKAKAYESLQIIKQLLFPAFYGARVCRHCTDHADAMLATNLARSAMLSQHAFAEPLYHPATTPPLKALIYNGLRVVTVTSRITVATLPRGKCPPQMFQPAMACGCEGCRGKCMLRPDNPISVAWGGRTQTPAPGWRAMQLPADEPVFLYYLKDEYDDNMLRVQKLGMKQQATNLANRKDLVDRLYKTHASFDENQHDQACRTFDCIYGEAKVACGEPVGPFITASGESLAFKYGRALCQCEKAKTMLDAACGDNIKARNELHAAMRKKEDQLRELRSRLHDEYRQRLAQQRIQQQAQAAAAAADAASKRAAKKRRVER